MEEWTPEVVAEFLNEMRLDNLIVYAISKDFEEECTEVEPVYGTKYCGAPLADVQAIVWDAQLPEKNIFIPEDLSVLPMAPEAAPSKIFNSEVL